MLEPLRQIGAYLVDRGPHVETQVGRDLLVAAAAAVQLVSRVANQRDQLLFDEMVDVFTLRCRREMPVTLQPSRQSASGPRELR